MTGLKEFMEVFGEITLGQVITWLLAIGCLIAIWKKGTKYINDRHDIDKKRDDEIEEAITEVRKYPEYRKQSIEVQEEINKHFSKIDEKFDNMQKTNTEIIKKLDQIEEERQKRDRNTLREYLLQGYRIFADIDKNPMQAWSEMEADSYWNIFSNYEDCNGDGYMHTIVQPAMSKLTVIKMDDEQGMFELMQSRKL